MTMTLVHNLMILLSAGLVAAIICRRLNVSILIGYLVVGAVIGHGALGWVVDEGHYLAHIAEFGVYLLLFSIGLEFSVDELRSLGWRFFVGGATQMLLVTGPLLLTLTAAGVALRPATLIALAAAFSSTVLVFRALTEFGQSLQPHGRRCIGILLFQDAALIPLLLFVPVLTGDADGPAGTTILQTGVTSVGLVLAVIGARHVLAEWIIPLFANFRSSELIVLFTLVMLGSVTLAVFQVGLPPAIGALAAGLIFNGNRWSRQIDALLLPFRETFAAVFFVGLGMTFDVELVFQEPILLLGILPAVILLKAIAAAVALRLTGLSLRTAAAAGMGLAHVGEFAFVLILQAVDSRVLTEADFQRLVIVAVGSLVVTPLLLQTGLRFIQQPAAVPEDEDSGRESESEKRAVVIGAGPTGSAAASQLETAGFDVCLIDLSPINLQPFAQQGIRTVAADATDVTVLRRAGAAAASMIVVCLPEDSTAIRIVQLARQLNQDARIIVSCRWQSARRVLYRRGATDVVAQEQEAALAVTRILSAGAVQTTARETAS